MSFISAFVSALPLSRLFSSENNTATARTVDSPIAFDRVDMDSVRPSDRDDPIFLRCTECESVAYIPQIPPPAGSGNRIEQICRAIASEHHDGHPTQQFSLDGHFDDVRDSEHSYSRTTTIDPLGAHL